MEEYAREESTNVSVKEASVPYAHKRESAPYTGLPRPQEFVVLQGAL